MDKEKIGQLSSRYCRCVDTDGTPVWYLGDVMNFANALLSASKPVAPAKAWATDDGRVISDAQKQQAIKDGGASASSVRPYSIALGEIAAAPAAPAQSVEPKDKSPRDPFGCLDCTHTDCGRFLDGERWMCHAMKENACARPEATQGANDA